MDHSEALHDELLLVVFDLLPLDALLQARAVCRRWRSLALDPRLWRHRDLMNIPDDDCRVAVVALRVAPCIRSVTIRHDFFVKLPRAFQEPKAVRRTQCAVAQLTLDLSDCTEWSSRSRFQRWLKQMLKRLVKLGAGVLRKVSLKGASPVRSASLLKLTLRADLDELELIQKSLDQNGNLSDKAASGNASLKTLRYDVISKRNSSPEDALQPLLRAHAATLETLAMECRWFSGDEELLLASCPKLRRLELGITASQRIVVDALSCRQITELTLLGMPNSQNVVSTEIVPAFRDATHLRQLALPDGSGSLEVLRALAERKSSGLEELCLGSVPSLTWGSLLDVLNGLPRLRSLSLTIVDGPLVRTGKVRVPNLLVLRVMYACHDSEDGGIVCGLPALHDLVRGHPQLHVVGLPSRKMFCCRAGGVCDGPPCSCCEHGLHPDSAGSGHFSLCGHGEAEQCSLETHSARPGVCPCSPDCQLPHTWQHVT